MEEDKEVSGNGNSYTTQFRQYDPRLGRWKSLDPLAAMFPDESPFVAFGNNPVYFTDPFGLKKEPTKATSASSAGSSGTASPAAHTGPIYDKGYSSDVVEITGVNIPKTVTVPAEPDVDSGSDISLGKLLDDWLNQFKGNGSEMPFGIEFKSNTYEGEDDPQGASVKVMPKNFKRVFTMDYEDFVMLEDIVGFHAQMVRINKVSITNRTTNKVNKMSRFEYRSSKRTTYQKVYMNGRTNWTGKDVKAFNNWADKHYEKYTAMVDRANRRLAAGDNLTDILDGALEDWLHEVTVQISGIRETSEEGYGPIPPNESYISIPHSTGTYEYYYDTGVWWHRGVYITDSVYGPVIDTTTIPEEVLKMIND